MLAEVVHGDGVVPVAQTVLGVGRLLLPPQAAHGQQDRCREARLERARGGEPGQHRGGREASLQVGPRQPHIRPLAPLIDSLVH